MNLHFGIRMLSVKQTSLPVVAVIACVRIHIAMAAGPEMPHNMPATVHHDGNRLCRSCHTLDSAAGLRRESSKKCARCHDQGEMKGTLMTAVTQGRAGNSTKESGTKLQIGMSTPMYYDTSRVGAEPNPMVLIPHGPFTMGTNERLPDEGPEHVVSLDAFYIDKYEVTNLQYKKFIDATDRHSPAHFRNRTFFPGKADHPVTFVSWYDAEAYCQWAGKRLPTDEEWEKAARGTDARTFAWGNEFAIDKANTPVRWERLHARGDTTPVGTFENGKSPYGLYDMSGNVWEWTASWYLPYPGNKRRTENYGKKYKTLKGGSWWDCSFYKCGISAPVFNRSFFNPRVRNESFGFRCARDAAQQGD